MPVTRADLRTAFPGAFDDVTLDDAIDQAILRAERRVGARAFGDRRDDGVLYQAAHMTALVIAARAAASSGAGPVPGAGGISSVSAGPVSMSFAAGSGGSGGGSSSSGGAAEAWTPYLGMYQDLARATVVRV